jgi:hypothetical protein
LNFIHRNRIFANLKITVYFISFEDSRLFYMCETRPENKKIIPNAKRQIHFENGV